MRRVCYSLALFGVFMFGVFGITACDRQQREVKIADCQFTVVQPEDIPEELLVLIDERKEKPFRMSYEDQGYLYIIQGYGMKEGGGYSITVDSLYETKNQIHFATTLHGSEQKEKEGNTTPYIVVKLEQIEKSIDFEN
ncbi:MAG: protease complex subunit PrcB family protein [Lachnospiraceae bacterium]|jgi:hypothetical protein|nr:protease complex subunit PrcB family protein [Lachnospiraceae bacterium]MCR4802490.1 protease complex subunit PrcB family protein [Lachnospiraceae bacterium]